MTNPLLETKIPVVRLQHRGKVRDNYVVGDHLLMVATDRLSAFDCVLPTGIPAKGQVLTQLSIFWFDFLKDIVPTHFVTADVSEYPALLHPYRDQLEGRSMLAKRARMIEIECVARGYLAGSGWKDYQRTGAICGVSLPSDLRQSSKLPYPIFSPATKAQSGHDENITFADAAAEIGWPLAERLRDLTLAIYSKASAYAETRGIILADTKFEFGFVDDQLVLADEVLTPDSSRFWPKESYRPGGPQPSYDKQYVRDYLETLDWDKRPPAPPLPADVAARTSEKYREAYRILTGRSI